MRHDEMVAKMLLDLGAVVLRPGEPFRYVSGSVGPIYCDNRLLLSHPTERGKVIDAFCALAKPLGFETVCGIATAGIPHAALLAERLGLPMVYVRDRKKDHGKERAVEGILTKGQRVLMVEDLINTGGSSIRAVESVREEGGVVEDCLAIFSYDLAVAREAFGQASCRLHSLTTLPVLLKVAQQAGHLTKEDCALVADWARSPKDWGARHGFGTQA